MDTGAGYIAHSQTPIERTREFVSVSPYLSVAAALLMMTEMLVPDPLASHREGGNVKSHLSACTVYTLRFQERMVFPVGLARVLPTEGSATRVERLAFIGWNA